MRGLDPRIQHFSKMMDRESHHRHHGQCAPRDPALVHNSFMKGHGIARAGQLD
jgi:hypothetical protein